VISNNHPAAKTKEDFGVLKKIFYAR
jgi:hypothetical protein